MFVKRDSQEWKYMWDKLAKNFINKRHENPTVCLNNSEAWQYMGTFNGQHEFRHRDHPSVLPSRVNLKIELSPKFNPEKDCEKV